MIFESSYRRQALDILKDSNEDEKKNLKKSIKHSVESKYDTGLTKIVKIFGF